MAKISSVSVGIGCLLLAVPSCFAARMQQNSKSAHQNSGDQDLRGDCAVAAIAKVCNCDKYSYKHGYQCSGCKDKMKWGYGCDLDCPLECGARGCDFSGNCIPDPHAPRTPDSCKRNSRIKDATSKSVTTNERNECQACDDGFFGLLCQSKCPANCHDTAEGHCSRGGKCYQCKEGFFGDDCSQKCPQGCPSCVMQDGLVADKDAPGEFLPAGYCNVQCQTDSWGPSCQKPCPTNCKKYKGPSCAKDTGFCKKCQDHKWFGATCDEPCSDGCEGGACNKGTGTCDNGCKPGRYGDRCDNQCPEGTVATCDRKTGEPHKCKEGSFPMLTEGVGECKSCPANCKNGHCYQDGTCSEGCVLGFFGATCEDNCPTTCEGPCDAKTTGLADGDCVGCQVGYTGSTCHKFCHKTCLACKQHGNAIGPDDCVSCPADQPTKLEGSTCKCIEGASRKTDTDPCVCDDPPDPNKDAFFELTPVKRCRPVCKDGTKEVLGDKESLCMEQKKYKAVILAEMAPNGFEQGKCGENEYEIPIKGEGSECIRRDFVQNIVKV